MVLACQVIKQSQEQRRRVLDSISKNVLSWVVKIFKVKAIYHTLNMLRPEYQSFIGEGFCPVDRIPTIQDALTRATVRLIDLQLHHHIGFHCTPSAMLSGYIVATLVSALLVQSFCPVALRLYGFSLYLIGHSVRLHCGYIAFCSIRVRTGHGKSQMYVVG